MSRLFSCSTVALVGIVCGSLAVETLAQVRMDPRGIAMAGAYTTAARDFYTVGHNPATLGIVRNYIALQLLQLSLGISNTSLSINEYARFNGAFLDSSKKEDLLALIPDEGLTLHFDTVLGVPLINFSLNNIAVTTNVVAVGDLTVPKAPFEVLLKGNEEGKNFPLEAGGESIALLELGFSNGGLLRGYLVGYTAKVLIGLAYANVDSSEGDFITDSTFIHGSGEYLLRRSSGGIGYAVDVGILGITVQGWYLGASLINALGTIHWTRDNEVRRYFYNIDNLNLNRIATRGFDELVTGGNELGADPGTFSTSYPTILRLGVSRHYGSALLAADYQQGFEERLFATKKARMAFGMELTTLRLLALRAGLALGGLEGKEAAFGFGLRFRVVTIDFAYAYRGGFLPNTAKGFQVSLGMALLRPY